MKPIAANDEARSVDSPVGERDLHAVLFLLERHQLVPEHDRYALRLGRLDDSAMKDRPAYAHRGIARVSGQARRVVVVDEDSSLVAEHGAVLEPLEGRAGERIRQAGDQPEHAQAVGLYAGGGSARRRPGDNGWGHTR